MNIHAHTHTYKTIRKTVLLFQCKQNSAAEKKLYKEISCKQEADRKIFETQKKKEYKTNKERWKRELSLDEATPKRQRDAALQ